MGNPTKDTKTNDYIYPFDYVTANISDEMKDLIERMICIGIDDEIDGDKILNHPIFHLQELKKLKQQRRHRRHHRHHPSHRHHTRSKSTGLVSTKIKSKPRLDRSESEPLPTMKKKVNTMKRTVKKSDQMKKTTMKKTAKKIQIRFGKKARKSKRKCNIAVPKLETITE